MSPEDFWRRVDKSAGPEGCWPWNGKRMVRDGRGVVYDNGREVTAPRIAWELFTGESIPPKMFACHHCDNPPCVNPAHIFIGTAGDNVRDMRDKGRMVLPNLSGENHPQATVPDSAVKEARLLYATGRFTQQEIADRLGVARVTVGTWVRRKRRVVGGAA